MSKIAKAPLEQPGGVIKRTFLAPRLRKLLTLIRDNCNNIFMGSGYRQPMHRLAVHPDAHKIGHAYV